MQSLSFVKTQLNGPFFSLVHFCAFHNSFTFFPSCLIPSIAYDTHIIELALVVRQTFHHLFFQLDLVGLAV
jgi:hypothetical protein